VNFADKLNLSSRPVNFALAGSAQANEDDADDADEPLQGEDREFLDWLLDRAGVSVTHYRPESLARRLPSCLRVLRASSPAHARSMIERNRLLTATAIDSVLIGVTSFFRDAQVFKDLDERVLAPLAGRASARVWSVGCSDGMELYTVAMQLARRRVLHRCQLLGTDCRIQATRFAAQGIYATQALRDVPDILRQSYFSSSDNNSQIIHPTIRASVQWRTADVLRTPEPGLWDLILCRNMAMYMRGDVVARLWDILQESLRPGGYLVLGKAERPNGASRMSNVAPCIFQRNKG
jgi:chemotaxis protein methyltransferase CheR